MKNLLYLSLLSTILLLGVGCQNSVNTIENSNKTMTQNRINDTRFITDGFLKDRLFIMGVDVTETPDGFMVVQVTMKNNRTGVLSQAWSGMTGENPYKIRYKISWLDQNGMSVESIFSTWKEVTIIPGEVTTIKGIAPQQNCKDFIMNLMEAN